MRIAIVGAGFCGLATAWHLLNHSPGFPLSSLVIIDSKGIGGGASGIAAGLMHPYAGAHAKLNWMGKEGMKATSKLLYVASEALDQPVATEQGILRLALNENQKSDFIQCRNQHPLDIDWLESSECHALFPHLNPAPGIWIKHGMIIHSSMYLKGLWLACKRQGAILEQAKISSWNELQDFDLAIIATGASAKNLPELSHLHLSAIKGQVLELAWPLQLSPLPFALNSQAYLIMNEKQHTCLAGATFERDYKDDQPDIERAKTDILPKVVSMLPELQSAPILNCYAGMRSVTPTHLPLISQVREREWIIAGMGSKGLLYHALMAEKLVNLIFLHLKNKT